MVQAGPLLQESLGLCFWEQVGIHNAPQCTLHQEIYCSSSSAWHNQKGGQNSVLRQELPMFAGVYDTVGSGAVHMMGGVAAFMGAWIAGYPILVMKDVLMPYLTCLSCA